MATNNRRRILAQQRGVVQTALAAARTLEGTVSGLSAALVHDWSLKYVPETAEITLPHRRRVRREEVRGLRVRRLDLHPSDVDGLVTTPIRTVLDCGRRLAFDEALCVADSALRAGVDAEELAAAAHTARGPGSSAMRRAVDLADKRSANAFESCLRAIAFHVPGLRLVPQQSIEMETYGGRPDLIDPHLRIVIEADSFEWHGSREALVSDAGRYNWFTVNGWLVLRFTWEDVLLHPEVVFEMLVAAVTERNRLKSA